MSFSSNRAENLAQLTVHKLMASFHDDNPVAGRGNEEAKRIAIREKKKQQKKRKRQFQQENEFRRSARFRVIKGHKQDGSLTEEEQKYLNKLVKKNVNAVNRLSEIEDYNIKHELAEVRRDILDQDASKRTSKASKRANKRGITGAGTKAKRAIAYPGLTPGLAPVGDDDDDDDED